MTFIPYESHHMLNNRFVQKYSDNEKNKWDYVGNLLGMFELANLPYVIKIRKSFLSSIIAS